jgi:hypothetical protein
MAKKMKKMKSVIVTVSDEGLNDMDNVAKQLGSSGMKLKQILQATGVITGSIASSKLGDLKKINGVMSVEEEVTSNLPPPDSSLQ